MLSMLFTVGPRQPGAADPDLFMNQRHSVSVQSLLSSQRPQGEPMAANQSHAFRLALKAAIACLGLSLAVPAFAVVFHGVDFPGGEASFADGVVSYDPAFGGGAVPTAAFRDPLKALGAPDFPEGVDPEYVSLGAGGRIVLRFTNNALTGSGNADLDLWIFEIGPDVEDTFVDISKDGSTWFSVGAVTGSTRGVDIDAFGFGTSDLFSFVRLTDNIALDATSGVTVGADIDAVGAISSTAPVGKVPEPATLLLLATGLAAGAFGRRK
jgi:hypothetical protein